MLLTDWGPTHDRWFRSGREHKLSNLRRLAEEFPNIQWLLIGDDGQHDEEIYTEFGRENPAHVAAVAIRRLLPAEAVLAGGRTVVDDHSDAGAPWLTASTAPASSISCAKPGCSSKRRRRRGRQSHAARSRRIEAESMCGRFVVARVASELVSVLRVDLVGAELPPPSFNVAPTASAAIVLDSAKTEPPTRRLEAARWGLVPSWAKDVAIGARAFQRPCGGARGEADVPRALEKRRAIVPVSGYYEWKTTATGKTPHYIRPADDAPLFLAGLYEWWRDPVRADDDPARWLLSFTIITRDAIGRLGSIHDRMPLFMDVDFADAWLDTDTDADNVRDLLDAAVDAAPAVAESLRDDVVAAAVGNVRNDSPELIVPLGDADDEAEAEAEATGA